MYSSIAKQAMEEVWGRTPNRFQTEIIPTILQMLTKDLSPEALLLVQPTGSGKSAVPQTTSVVTNGVSIIIEPTLALSSDQASKFDKASKEYGGLVYSYQLDLYKKDNDRQALANNIITVLEKKKHQDVHLGIVSFVLFTSPEALVLPIWMTFVDKLIKLEMLNLICIDEVHLFIEFGLSFRKEFLSLRDNLFKKIIVQTTSSTIDTNSINSTNLKVPFLCMTATFNLLLLNLIQKMTKITFNHRQLHWSNKSEFQKRHISISMKYTNQFKRYTKVYLRKYLKPTITSKAIICGNVASKLVGLEEDVRMWMTSPTDGFSGTTALVVGSEDAIRKQLYTIAFTKKWSTADIEDPSKFTPRVLLGTSGCIGTGLDCDDVTLMVRLGLPTSLLHLIQEMGRCGRKRNTIDGLATTMNCYHVMFTLNDYVYLTERLYMNDIQIDTEEDRNNPDESSNSIEIDPEPIILSIDEERSMHRKNLERCLGLFCLSNGCWHTILEKECGNPFTVSISSDENPIQDCNRNCPQCDGTISSLVKPVVRTGLMSFLAYAFGDMYTGLVTPTQLAKQLFDFKDVGLVVYKRSKSINAESIGVTQLTIMQLIASRIIKVEVDVSGKRPVAHCKLCFDKSDSTSQTYMQPTYTIDSYWYKINMH